jgi:lysophospholipase L1-like esterase
MAQLVDALLCASEAEVLVLGPTPILDAPGVPESYGQAYWEVARDRGVAFVNLAPAISILAEEDMKRAYGDNVHLSAYGHSVIGKAVAEGIIELAK